MSLLYRFLYRFGITPWERMASLPAGQQISALLDQEEEGREPPYGSVLDLGCGSGIWSVELAKRGWDVTGVDVVPKALGNARKRAESAGVEIRLVKGDITALEKSALGSNFRLMLDLGVVHGMNDADRARVARGMTGLASADATLLVLAFSPGGRGPAPRGMSREDVEATYGGWSIVDSYRSDLTGAPGIVKRSQPSLYRLRRA